MRALLRLLFVIVLVVASAGPAFSRRKKATHTPPPGVHKRSDAEIEAATRVQIFLDRANFSPGKIDGHYNDLTRRALALYSVSRGEKSQTPPTQRAAKSNVAPDVKGHDLASVNQVLIPYTETEAVL